jgi:hypothetical protein
MDVAARDLRVRALCEREASVRDLLVRSRPKFDEVRPQMKVPQMVQPFRQGREPDTGAQSHKALHESFVTRERNRLERLRGLRPNRIGDRVRRDSETSIDRFVKRREHQYGRVQVADVLE